MTTETLKAQAEITGETLTLRPLRLADKGPIEMHTSDARVANMTTSIPHPLPPGATDAFIARATDPKRGEDMWAMDTSAQGGADLAGVISLTRLDKDQSEIRYWVAPAYWNAGLASDALRLLVDANPLGNKTYFGIVFQENAASARVLTNCGFEYIGDAETFCVSRAATLPTWTYLRKLD